eukprot:TRINITY_DN1126_c0_g1_i1.p1 TRINITY_DN1126_c0_g1~~TRINITY_DN1126_c0_g1_i1.p1  ORF type:complete len:385 (+),score=97.63 TRINITY_DN1126_c0_g1_i1:116-1270(+)
MAMQSAFVALVLFSSSIDAALIHRIGEQRMAAPSAAPMAAPSAAPGASPMAAMSFGNPKCPCVGVAGIEGYTKATVSSNLSVNFPADFGARCETWDNDFNPLYCKPGQKPGQDNGWCKEPWCYVDPCNCEIDEPASQQPEDGGYLPRASYQGKGMWYSYATCGGKDYWLEPARKKKHQEEPERPAVCAVQKDEELWGASNCPCIGFAGQVGTTNVSIEPGKEMAYPADTGSTCRLWDYKRHPDCKSKDPPKWCEQAWCYVDPCNCRSAVPPKLSAYLPDASASEKPIYYSYATCGGVDKFAASNKKACVNLKSAKFCDANSKCAWNGMECLGRELVEICGNQVRPAAKPAKRRIPDGKQLPPVTLIVLGVIALFGLITIVRSAP